MMRWRQTSPLRHFPKSDAACGDVADKSMCLCFSAASSILNELNENNTHSQLKDRSFLNEK